MAVVEDKLSIHAVTNKYGSQARQIKDLITQFESAQQYGISNKQKELAENINLQHI